MREGRGWGSGGLRPALPQVQASAHLPFPATAISARRLRDGAEVHSTPQHLPGILSSLFLPRVLWSASATLRLSVEPPHPAPPRPTPPKSGSATRLRGRPRVRPQGRQSSRWTVCPHLLPTFWADPPAVLTAADAMELRSSPTRFSPHHFGTAGAGEGKFIRPKLGRILLIQSSCSLAESTWHSAVSRSPIGLNGALSKFGGFHPFGTSQSRVTADGFRDPAKQLFVPVCGEAGTSRSVR